MIYFDSTYIAKCYLPERGHHEVLALAESEGTVATSLLALIEVAAVFHRKLREGEINPREHRELSAQFDEDRHAGVWTFLPITELLAEASAEVFSKLPANTFLRSADCIHLSSAVEAGLPEIYSNDRHLLAAAPCFGLRGVNVIRGSD